MDDWYRYYRAEIDRRGEEIKAAEKYRLMELARNGPDAPRVPKIHQRLFSALRAWLFHQDNPKNVQHPVSPRLYGHERS